MGKNKLEHFAETATFPHFFQPDFETLNAGFEYQGCWKDEFFENDFPLCVELGCGKGEYTVGLARNHPECNYIGVDIKGARMWRGAKTSVEEDLLNVAFIRIKVEQLAYCFSDNELDEIWITFPDPHVKIRQERKRLTSPRFLEMYRKLLGQGGRIHLKTDNRPFFEYSLLTAEAEGCRVLFKTFDLYNSGFEGDACNFQTYYEKKFLQEKIPINYMIFTFD